MSTLEDLRARYRRWLFDEALPLWWTVGADHVNGGFHEALTLEGVPVMANRRARVQARQIYVYATAGEMGWKGPWREAVGHGLAFFLDHYLRPDGLIRASVRPDGSPAVETTVLYDQAFALFALASAARVGSDSERLRAIALRMREAVIAACRSAQGGYQEIGDPAHPWQANAHMHLLEAALAWAEIDPDPAWNELADEIVALCLAHFIDAEGQLHEFYAADWSFAPGVEGRIIEPGHQFEWAWLLIRWGLLRGRTDGVAVGRRLVESGLDGVDARGVATQRRLDDGAPHDDVARLWPQTEWIKAATISASLDAVDKPRWEAETVRAGEALWKYLDTPLKGMWRDKLRPDGSWVDEPAPASSFYHIVCALNILGVRTLRS